MFLSYSAPLLSLYPFILVFTPLFRHTSNSVGFLIGSFAFFFSFPLPFFSIFFLIHFCFILITLIFLPFLLQVHLSFFVYVFFVLRRCNGFAIVDHSAEHSINSSSSSLIDPSSTISSSSEQRRVAFALFPFASLFNHSCVPNCIAT